MAFAASDEIEQSPFKWRPYLIALCIVAVAAITFQVMSTCRGRMGPEGHSRRLIDCFNNKDARCIAEFATSTDLAAYGITSRESEASFIREYVLPRLEHIEPEDTNFTRTSSFEGKFKFVLKAKEGIFYPAEVNLREEGVACHAEFLVPMLWGFAEFVHKSNRYQNWGTMRGIISEIHFLTEEKESLTKMGVTGVSAGPSSGMVTLENLLVRLKNSYRVRRMRLKHPESLPLDPMEIINDPSPKPPTLDPR